MTLWSGGLSVLLIALRWITGSNSGSKLSVWTTLIALVFAFCGAWLTFRWIREKLMWRLRHRLIVTYIFIGVIPIVLLLLLFSMVGYLFAGQFATYIALSGLQSASERLNATNSSMAAELSALERSGELNEEAARKLVTVSDESFPQRIVTVWRRNQGFIIAPGRTSLEIDARNVPDGIQGDFSGFAIDEGRLQLRAIKSYDQGGVRIIVMSTVPITPELLGSATSHVGSVTLLPPDRTLRQLVRDAG